MKKRLLKVMPHIPICKLRPELPKPGEESDYSDDDDNDERNDGDDAAEIDANTTFHNFDGQIVVNLGMVQGVNRFMRRSKVNVKKEWNW